MVHLHIPLNEVTRDELDGFHSHVQGNGDDVVEEDDEGEEIVQETPDLLGRALVTR